MHIEDPLHGHMAIFHLVCEGCPYDRGNDFVRGVNLARPFPDDDEVKGRIDFFVRGKVAAKDLVFPRVAEFADLQPLRLFGSHITARSVVDGVT